MKSGFEPQILPELTLVDGDTTVLHTSKAPDARLLAAESAMVSSLQMILKHSPEKPESEESAMLSMVKPYGFGPMFTII